MTQIEDSVIHELFPHIDNPTLAILKRASTVDFLMGLERPSWHPKLGEGAVGNDGDLWLYRSRFGSCVGGSHPLIEEKTKKSDSLFVVNHTYHMDVSRNMNNYANHELEFCERRVANYFVSRVKGMQPERKHSGVLQSPIVQIPPTIRGGTH